MLGPYDLLELRVLLPPFPEQAEIVEYLEKITASIDATIARARHEINLLREYHTCLTADVVTGKVDVRGIELPENTEAASAEEMDRNTS